MKLIFFFLLYSEEKAKISRKLTGMIEEKNEELGYVNSFELSFLLLSLRLSLDQKHFSHDCLPLLFFQS